MDPHRLPARAFRSSRRLAKQGDNRSWYAKTARWLLRFGIHMDKLPPFQYDLHSPLLVLPQEDRNKLIRADLLQLHTKRTWGEMTLSTKLLFYREHFLRLTEEGFIQRPRYLTSRMSHALRVALGQIRVSSHQLQIEAGRALDIPRERRLCTLCSLGEIESEDHFLFNCPVYYEIRGRYHCLFRDGFGPLSRVIDYEDQKCLALFVLEIGRHRTRLIKEASRTNTDHPPPDQQRITDFFHLIDTEVGEENEHENENENGNVYEPNTDTHTHGRRRPRAHTLQVAPQVRRTRPRTTMIRTIEDTFRGIRRGVTIDTARHLQAIKKHRTSKPRPSTSKRQTRTQEALRRHRSRPGPTGEVSFTQMLGLTNTTMTGMFLNPAP